MALQMTILFVGKSRELPGTNYPDLLSSNRQW